ncbi:MAG: PqqD family protein [Chitinispirillaceae bacterium]|nr:PqqD family protein [Chitinispirillaceae bacterium]
MRLKIVEKLLVRKIDDEVFIYDRERANVHSFNGVGAFIWCCIEKSYDEEAIINALLEEYEVDKTTADRDLRTFVGTITERGLLEP